MKQDIINKTKIHKAMTILDILSTCRETEAVFRKYDKKAGVCLCCEALFDSLEDISTKYGVELNSLIEELERVRERDNPEDRNQKVP